jgi:hypothetical protein
MSGMKKSTQRSITPIRSNASSNGQQQEKAVFSNPKNWPGLKFVFL